MRCRAESPENREAGEIPARSRHRKPRALGFIHWETGKDKFCFRSKSFSKERASDRRAGKPALHCTGKSDKRFTSHEALVVRRTYVQYVCFDLYLRDLCPAQRSFLMESFGCFFMKDAFSGYIAEEQSFVYI